jgi:transcription elongation factor GreA
MSNIVYLTQEGLEELQSELKNIEENLLPKVKDDLEVANSQGDFSENSARDIALANMQELQTRKDEIIEILNNYELIEEGAGGNIVRMGNTVKIQYVDLGKDFELKIVGGSEADIFDGKIGNESPIAKAIIGHKAGQTVEVLVNKNTKHKVKILDILS